MKKLILFVTILFLVSLAYSADIEHPVDLGQTKVTEHGKEIVNTKKCFHCNRQLCICPERQADGSWKDIKEERIKLLEEKVEALEAKQGG